MVNDELMHYGVKGQKWGVRRYQRADGTYTPAGRKRRAREAGREAAKESWEQSKASPNAKKLGSGRKAMNASAAARRKAEYASLKSDRAHNKQIRAAKKTSDWSEDARTAHDINQKNVKQMSNAELKKLNERTRLEQEYSRLNPNTVQQGWKYVAAGAATAGTLVGLYNNSQTLIKVGQKIVDRLVR